MIKSSLARHRRARSLTSGSGGDNDDAAAANPMSAPVQRSRLDKYDYPPTLSAEPEPVEPEWRLWIHKLVPDIGVQPLGILLFLHLPHSLFLSILTCAAGPHLREHRPSNCFVYKPPSAIPRVSAMCSWLCLCPFPLSPPPLSLTHTQYLPPSLASP